MKFNNSKKLYQRALKLMPGGVNSPVRAFKGVDGFPFYTVRGKGPYIYDADGNQFLDYVNCWGALISGHANLKVARALKEAINLGTGFGTCHTKEIELAELIIKHFPSIERIRFVNSGTEAVMSAIRLARGFTGKNKIIKFEGCYHGHSDSLLAKAGSGFLTFGLSDSLGVPESVTKDTIVLPYNNPDLFSETIEKLKDEIACVIVEPIAANIGVVLPQEGFLKVLRDLTKKYNIILIFDEVITGFRVDEGGAQRLYNIKPDLTCLGKIIGGGLPVGAYGGRAEIMEKVAPAGVIYQAGTLSGNPVVLAAGIETLKILEAPGFYENLKNLTDYLKENLEAIFREFSIPVRINTAVGMLTVYFSDSEVIDYKTAKSADTKVYAKFFNKLLEKGIYFPPSQFEAVFLSGAMSKNELNFTVNKVREILKDWV